MFHHLLHLKTLNLNRKVCITTIYQVLQESARSDAAAGKRPQF